MARVSKQLICPVCGQVMATAVWRMLRGLEITTPDGFVMSPISDDLLLRVAQQRLAAASADDQPEAQRRLNAILRRAARRELGPPIHHAGGDSKSRTARTRTSRQRIRITSASFVGGGPS